MTTMTRHTASLACCILSGALLLGCDSATGGNAEIEYRVIPNGSSQVEQILYTNDSGQEVEVLDVSLPCVL